MMKPREEQTAMDFGSMSADDLLQRALKIQESLARAKQGKSSKIVTPSIVLSGKPEETVKSTCDSSLDVESKNDASKMTAPTVAMSTDVSTAYADEPTSELRSDNDDDCGSDGQSSSHLVTTSNADAQTEMKDESDNTSQTNTDTRRDETIQKSPEASFSALANENESESTSDSNSDHDPDSASVERITEPQRNQVDTTVTEDNVALHKDLAPETKSDSEQGSDTRIQNRMEKAPKIEAAPVCDDISNSSSNSEVSSMSSRSASDEGTSDEDSGSSSSESSSSSSSEETDSSSAVSSKFSNIFSKNDIDDISSLDSNYNSSSESDSSTESDSDSDSDLTSQSDSASESGSDSDSASEFRFVSESESESESRSQLESKVEAKPEVERDESPLMADFASKKEPRNVEAFDTNSELQDDKSPHASLPSMKNETDPTTISNLESDQDNDKTKLAREEPANIDSESETEALSAKSFPEKEHILSAIANDEYKAQSEAEAEIYEEQTIPNPLVEEVAADANSQSESERDEVVSMTTSVTETKSIAKLSDPESESHDITTDSAKRSANIESAMSNVDSQDLNQPESESGDKSSISITSMVEEPSLSAVVDLNGDDSESVSFTEQSTSRSLEPEFRMTSKATTEVDDFGEAYHVDECDSDNAAALNATTPNDTFFEESHAIELDESSSFIDTAPTDPGFLPDYNSLHEPYSGIETYLDQTTKESTDIIDNEFNDYTVDLENDDRLYKKDSTHSSQGDDSHHPFLGYVGNDDNKTDTDSEIEIIFSQRSSDDSTDDDEIFDVSLDENQDLTQEANLATSSVAMSDKDSLGTLDSVTTDTPEVFHESYADTIENYDDEEAGVNVTIPIDDAEALFLDTSGTGEVAESDHPTSESAEYPQLNDADEIAVDDESVLEDEETVGRYSSSPILAQLDSQERSRESSEVDVDENEKSFEQADESLDDPEILFASLGIESSASSANNDLVETEDDPDSLFSNLRNTRKNPPISNNISIEGRSTSPVEETTYNPDAFFANLTKARENAGIKRTLSTSNDELQDEQVEEVTDAVRNQTSPIPQNAQSNLIDSSVENRVNGASSIATEPFLVNLSEPIESPSSRKSLSHSDGNSIENSDEESIDDPELFYSNILDASARQESRIPRGGLPDILEDQYQNDGLEDLGDSYERFLAGISGEATPNDAYNPEIEKDFVDIGQAEQQYPSNYSDDDMSNLYREMKNIGLSPNIVVKSHDSMGVSVRSSLSAKWSVGGDSYLDDLLTQKDEMEDEHREEVMEEALAQYDTMDGPKSEEIFLEILENVKAKKQEAFEKKAVAHDKLISQELEFRKHPSKRKLFLTNQQPTQVRNDDETYPELGQTLPTKGTSKPVRNKKKKTKPTKSDRVSSKKAKNRKQDKNRKRRTKRKDDSKKKSRQKKKDVLPRAQNRNEKSLPEEPIFVEDTAKRSGGKKSSGKRNRDIEKGRKKKSTLPMVEDSPSVSSQQLSFTCFDDEYYYDEERAMLDRKALSLLQQEAQLSQEEFKLTKKRMLAAVLMCCLAFGLILVFVLDPLQKRGGT